jgi:hypothetical protein
MTIVSNNENQDGVRKIRSCGNVLRNAELV